MSKTEKSDFKKLNVICKQVLPESDFSVFDIQNRFLRILKPGKSWLYRFLTECHFYTDNIRIRLKLDFSVLDIQNRFIRY